MFMSVTLRTRSGDRVVPVKWFGVIQKGLYMDENGDVYSTSRDPFGNKLTPKYNKNSPNDYPKINCKINGERVTRKIHRLVAHTLLEHVKPARISQSDWDATPESVKDLIYRDAMEVNHIDEDHGNYHPSNLEWVTRGENRASFHSSPNRSNGSYYEKTHLEKTHYCGA